MSLTASPEAGFRVRGWHVAAGVCAFFAVVIGVDAAFLVTALRTHPGQVSVTPYEDGLLYNRSLAQQAEQAKLGWRASAEATPGQVIITLHDRQGHPVSGLKVAGRLARPATEAGRRDLTFSETAPGRYAAPAGALSGAWDLSAEAAGGGRRFAAERRLTWP